ncbi:MAG: D-aminoacyl-tRNA deacylase [Phycisphaerae bacterium]|nr:D-aminoacyl-tRNA deacylase [Phycisphaerae bacterium]
MRAAVQRVHEANVTVDGQVVGSVSQGLLVYAGVAVDDTEADARYIAEKVAGLRIFNDPDGKMNLNVSEVGGGVLVISAFTLQADARKGRRPSFDAAAGPELALSLYERLCELLVGMGLAVAKGVFRAHMEVNSINDGPICVLLDSKRTF